ncbi:hypothetical protein MKX08_007422 [Trichoderma sp. CBMAI-0020]|nr:hypothetical protein MKX08_007422 [Trichoderma sp. CBMAI-0020]
MRVFCWFHSKQVYGLYRGYKRRNASLDALDDESPSYLKKAKITLANQKFEDIEDEGTLRVVHSHLFEQYVLIGKVIDARKLHHTHFYSLQVDYGHQAYIDKLSSRRQNILQSLEKLEKRTADLLYRKEQWFAWVRRAQEEEEATRLGSIKDMELDKRTQYIDLIKHFLWMDVVGADGDQEEASADPVATSTAAAPTQDSQTPAKKAKKRSSAKRGATKSGNLGVSAAASIAERGQKRLMAIQEGKNASKNAGQHVPDKKKIETEREMRKRLSEGVDKKMENIWGFQLVGSLENPHETYNRTAPMTNDEIESAVKDIREIKLLLFCRLLLAQASMLPAALRFNSVEEFLNDADIVDSDLRDLCLKLEDPSLQQIRDTCADFARGDDAEEEADDISDESDTEDEDGDTFADTMADYDRYKHLHTASWLPEKLFPDELKPRKEKTRSSSQKIRVTLCGKSVWNHASEKAMSRDGWLQFSIIAKDCDLKHAIQLCRNWAEFSDLNLLTHWQYFPASNWASWGTNRLIQQLQELEFFPYFIDLDAQQYSRHLQVGGRSKIRRQHDMVEGRNIIVGHMKRSNPVTRRFLQYLTMRTGEVLVLVRDGKSGRVITAPPDKHLWTYRRKHGVDRASKNEWDNVLEVGPDYFDMTDSLREWRFGFQDYYDVFIWSFVPDESPMDMYNVVITVSLELQEKTLRTRKIVPGEHVESIWDQVMGEQVQFRLFNIQEDKITSRTTDELGDSPYMFYSKANVAEDEILFPDEATSNKKSLEKSWALAREGKRPAAAFEETLDSDEGSIWALPKIWKTAFAQFRQETRSVEQRKQLSRTGLDAVSPAQLLAVRLEDADFMEIMERDRSFGFKESFHQGDLEPDYDDYAQDPAAPWPHPFIVQDLVQAFMMVAMFFPESNVTANVTAFLKSDQCESFRNSLLFSPQERCKSLPDRRSRTSYRYRDKKFWDGWNEVLKGPGYFTDIFPLDWSINIRPTIAKLYRAGIITPAYCQNDPQIVPGVAVAATEPHRPDDLDLFICYEDRYKNFPQIFPPSFIGPDKWTTLLPHAQAFASKHQGARFALLRLWSAPHFYPLMVGQQNRQGNSFVDSVGRTWEWKFVPKDMPGSEFSVHHTVSKRLELLKEQFGDRVYSRADLILIMGEDVADLLKYCVAVTFAVQTKPWLREVDLWKSFINVELDFLQQLDPYWLD